MVKNTGGGTFYFWRQITPLLDIRFFSNFTGKCCSMSFITITYFNAWTTFGFQNKGVVNFLKFFNDFGGGSCCCLSPNFCEIFTICVEWHYKSKNKILLKKNVPFKKYGRRRFYSLGADYSASRHRIFFKFCTRMFFMIVIPNSSILCLNTQKNSGGGGVCPQRIHFF